MPERSITNIAREEFGRHDFLVVPGVYDHRTAGDALRQTSQIQYFGAPTPLDGTLARVAKIKGRSALPGTGLGNIIQAISLNGVDLELNFDEEKTVIHRARKDGGPIVRIRDSRVNTYEIPSHSSVVYHLGQWGVGAVTPLEGRLWVWSSSGRSSELLHPGDIAFTGSESYHLEPFVGESSTALVVAGERFAYELPELTEFIAA